MALMRSLNQYLKNRNGRWRYRRRVPIEYRDLDPRDTIRASLKTSSLEVARARRDALAEADDLYWASLRQQPADKVVPAIARYRAAKKRAMARGYIYTPVEDLAETAQLNDILERLNDVDRTPTAQKPEADALLGTVKPASPKLSEAFEIYCNQLAASDLRGKSEAQKRNWRKVKQRAVNNFLALFGDLTMDKITRKHGRELYKWWGEPPCLSKAEGV